MRSTPSLQNSSVQYDTLLNIHLFFLHPGPSLLLDPAAMIPSTGKSNANAVHPPQTILFITDHSPGDHSSHSPLTALTLHLYPLYQTSALPLTFIWFADSPHPTHMQFLQCPDQCIPNRWQSPSFPNFPSPGGPPFLLSSELHILSEINQLSVPIVCIPASRIRSLFHRS